MQPDDPWSRVDYRRLIAWPQRIEREWPFLERVLSSAPAKRVLDLGSGTGEHSRQLAANGFDVLGIEASGSMLEKAREAPLPPNLRFTQGDIADLASLAGGHAGGAICLGNTLPHLDEPAMRRLTTGLADVLVPGGSFVFQILNYERILAKRVRHLPVNIRDDGDGGEIVFLRLMDPRPEDGTVLFTPTTLSYRPEQDPPIAVTSARTVKLRAWTWPELRPILAQAGFSVVQAFGGFDSVPYDPGKSADLVVVARR
jgi:SAM-dependent methyltransferase